MHCKSASTAETLVIPELTQPQNAAKMETIPNSKSGEYVPCSKDAIFKDT